MWPWKDHKPQGRHVDNLFILSQVIISSFCSFNGFGRVHIWVGSTQCCTVARLSGAQSWECLHNYQLHLPRFAAGQYEQASVMKRASLTLLLLPAWLCFWHTDARAPEHVSLQKTDNDVEHEVDEREALFLAKELFRFKGMWRCFFTLSCRKLSQSKSINRVMMVGFLFLAPAKSGCGPCSSRDMDYCWGTDLLDDHCCCDHDLPGMVKKWHSSISTTFFFFWV